MNTSKLRFVTNEQAGELIDLYHIARMAIQNDHIHPRMIYVITEFTKKYPTITRGKAYKDLCALIER